MITETTYLEQSTTTTTKSPVTAMVVSDQSSDFTNSENKSETLNVVTNGTYSFRTNMNSKLNNNEGENESDFDDTADAEADDSNDFSRPKKLQKGNSLATHITGNQPQNQLECDFSLAKTNPQSKQSGANSKPLSTNENNNTSESAVSCASYNSTSNARRKANLVDNEYEDNVECYRPKDGSPSSLDNSPKVPPLRIVISSSTSGRKDLNNQSVNSNNYVVSTSMETTSSNENKKEETNFYLTRSSSQSSAPSSNTSAANGRITTRSQRAAAALNHFPNDDSQSSSRYSPEEFAGELSNDTMLTVEQPVTGSYLNSQNMKEKESNKENKDSRRRKGRGKGALQSNVTTASSTTVSSSTGSASNNSNISNACSSSTGDQQLQASSSEANAQSNSEDALSLTTDQSMINLSTVNSRDYQMPAYNCYNMFQNIRKQVEKRRQTMCDSANSKTGQKEPQGFKDYLLNTGNYLLESRSEAAHNVNPNLTLEQIDVPELLKGLANTSLLVKLYKEQTLEREKMKVQHLVEREKVKLSIEQEILRVHNRASLAMANQSLPLSFTVLMKDEEIYNSLEADTDLQNFDLRGTGNNSAGGHNLDSTTSGQKESSTCSKNEYSRATYCISNNTYTDLFTLTGKSEDIGSRCRYSGRLLHSWLQDVEDKWSKIKKEILNRQRREGESLQARQKLEWEWQVKELSKKLKIHEVDEEKSNEKFNEKKWSDDVLLNESLIPVLIPLIPINESFYFS